MQHGQFFELVGGPQFTMAAGPAGYGNVHIPAISPAPVYAPLKPAYSFSMPPPVRPVSSFSSLSSNQRRIINSAEKRANHNAIERARRDSLNNRFLEIAECIPQLRELKKPSKSIIMQKTLEYVRMSSRRFDAMSKEIQALKKENQALREELNALKGIPPSPQAGAASSASAVGDAEAPADPMATSELKVDLSEFNIKLDPSDFAGFDALDVDLHSSVIDMRPLGDNGDHHMLTESSAPGESAEASTRGTPFISDEDELQDGSELIDDLLSEQSDTFEFDVMKERVESGLSFRHDKDWLINHGIMRQGPRGAVAHSSEFEQSRQQLEFKMRARSLNGKLSSRPTVDELIDMHILEP